MNKPPDREAMIEAREQYLQGVVNIKGQIFADATEMFSRSMAFLSALSSLLERAEVDDRTGGTAMLLARSHLEYLINLYVEAVDLTKEQTEDAAQQGLHMLEQMAKIAQIELGTQNATAQ